MRSHSIALLAAYLAIVAGWWIAVRVLAGLSLAPSTWRDSKRIVLPHPWREVGFALVGALLVLGVGQLWTRGWIFTATGALAPLVEALNQFLIFLPILALPCVRRQGLRTMLFPSDRIATRLVVGLALAFLALVVVSIVQENCRSAFAMSAAILHFENASQAVQVLAEDLAIGIFLYRLAAAMSRRWTVVAVAALFALGHVPALLSGGANAAEFASLAFDFVLGLVVIGTVLRSGDVLWFWPIHFALDLTQFSRISGG